LACFSQSSRRFYCSSPLVSHSLVEYYRFAPGTVLVPSIYTQFRQKSETPTSDSSVESGRPCEANHPDRPTTVTSQFSDRVFYNLITPSYQPFDFYLPTLPIYPRVQRGTPSSEVLILTASSRPGTPGGGLIR
ncbi:hypothetical protein RSAG8_00940, partial [Rhizoctonia solani AG-8 WAC10335]